MFWKLLLQSGVYVKRGRGLSIGETLYEFIKTGYEEWYIDVERPMHNQHFRTSGRMEFNKQKVEDDKKFMEPPLEEAPKTLHMSLED